MNKRPLNVLVLCTGNSARSILAESLFNTLGAGRVRAWSAGSRPAGQVNPFALERLRAAGHPTEGLRSKSWNEFEGPDAPEMDVVITVCGNAAGEVCPVWRGVPLRAHWGLDDPAAAHGSDEDRRRAFERAFEIIARRVEAFLVLPFEELEPDELARELARIGTIAAQ